MIPRRLIRVVPEHTTDEVEAWWEHACALHSSWYTLTLRDPISREFFPMTRCYWDDCESGAQLADLIRAEELYQRGGVYIDSDVEVYKSFTPLLGLRGFAGYDSTDHIPNAVMGFEPGHPALHKVINMAIRRQDQGTWAAGVGVTTEVFKHQTSDMALFPPGSFYPLYWRMAQQPGVDWAKVREDNPWAFCAHHAHHSWKNVAK